mgnify:CR=1 FL=1
MAVDFSLVLNLFGSVGVQASTDWRGNDVDPGCMPCPNGTFNNQWGRESCFLCDPATQSCGVGTVTPLPAHVKPWEWTQTARTHWKVPLIHSAYSCALTPFVCTSHSWKTHL